MNYNPKGSKGERSFAHMGAEVQHLEARQLDSAAQRWLRPALHLLTHTTTRNPHSHSLPRLPWRPA
jgi:hypothetical protein